MVFPASSSIRPIRRSRSSPAMTGAQRRFPAPRGGCLRRSACQRLQASPALLRSGSRRVAGGIRSPRETRPLGIMVENRLLTRRCELRRCRRIELGAPEARVRSLPWCRRPDSPVGAAAAESAPRGVLRPPRARRHLSPVRYDHVAIVATVTHERRTSNGYEISIPGPFAILRGCGGGPPRSLSSVRQAATPPTWASQRALAPRSKTQGGFGRVALAGRVSVIRSASTMPRGSPTRASP